MTKKKAYTCVLVETDDEGITWITFNRPEKRNAMSPTLHIEIQPHQGKEVREQIKYLHKYGWSSLGGYLDAKKKQSWVSYDTVLSQIGASRKKYEEFVYEGMWGGYGTPWEKLKGKWYWEKRILSSGKRGGLRVKDRSENSPRSRSLKPSHR